MEKLPHRDVDFTKIELAIMRQIWAGNVTTRTISDGLDEKGEFDIKISTLSTYIGRMIQKDFIRREMSENREFIYIPLISEEEAQESYSRRASDFPGPAYLMKSFAGKAEDNHLKTLLTELSANVEKWFKKK